MPSDSQYRDYRSELNGPKAAASARVGVLVVIGLNTAFIALDYWAHPAQFAHLAALRLLWDVAMVGVYWALGRYKPLPVMHAGLYLTGFGMLGVIGLAGGLTSNYWPGMMILFLGIPVVLPLSVREVALVVSTLSLGFLGLPLVSAEDWNLNAALAPMFFVCGAAIECVASTAALERLRLQDFKQRREIESARDHLREMDRVKARFTANVHHELRTPLTLTLAPVEGLLAGDFGEIPPVQRSYLRTVQSNARRLLKLINNLLDLAKIESGQLSVTRRPVKVEGIVGELVSGARPLAETKGVSLLLNLGSNIPEVNADADAIEKVVMNLLGNALKFTASGDRVTVAVEPALEGGILMSIADTGPGLAGDQLERIFDRFAQVDTSATRKHEGTGIGLSLTRELVELHGGRVWAESPGLGEGATLHVWLPVGEPDMKADELLSDDAEARPTSANAGDRFGDIERALHRSDAQGAVCEMRPRGNDERPSVLICEDNPDMRRLLRDLVGREYQVRLAENGQVGLEAARARLPDLVLTDVMMPEMSGTELCAALKADPATAGVPVVLVTSKAEREMKLEGLEGGADDYVTKPFHARELLARIRSLVKLRRMSTELESQNEALERAMAELREAEAQLVRSERLAAVGELAAGLAHEVNNPVNFALNAARTLGPYTADLKKAVSELGSGAGSERVMTAIEDSAAGLQELSEIIIEGLGRTSRLVGDLRDLAAPGSGSATWVDLRQTVESAVQLTGHFLEKRGVVVDVQCAESIPSVYGDGQGLGQVILNILKNAAEAFGTTGGTVRVEIRAEDGGALVAISDNGPGVQGIDRERIFDPFVTTKAAGQGTGLGLSISKRIVDEHGGKLDVVASPEGGATFRLWLPEEKGHGG